MRCAFSRLDYGSLALRPVASFALLSELTRLTPSQRGRLHPGFRRFGHPPRRRISLQCQLGNLHWRDFHSLDHQFSFTALSRRTKIPIALIDLQKGGCKLVLSPVCSIADFSSPLQIFNKAELRHSPECDWNRLIRERILATLKPKGEAAS